MRIPHITSVHLFGFALACLAFGSSSAQIRKAGDATATFLLREWQLATPVNAVLMDRSGLLWIGSDAGLFRFDGYSFKQYRYVIEDSSTLSNNRVTAIAETPDGALWIHTADGLNRFDRHGNNFRQVRSSVPITSMADAPAEFPRLWTAVFGDRAQRGTMKAPYIDRLGNLWLGTETGLLRLTRRKGLHTQSPQDDAGLDDEITVPVSSAIAGMTETGGTSRNRHGPLVVSRMTVSDTLYLGCIDSGDTVRVWHEHTGLSLQFALLDFIGQQNIRYEYMLEDADRTWIPADESRIARYEQLAPGEYLFRARAWNGADGTLAGVLTITLRVESQYYRAPWFRNTLILFAASLLASGLGWRLRSLRRTARIERRLLESEIKALRLQMNPHFMFNALNAIQYHIMNQDSVQACSYLATFSRLMRLILENSRQQTVTIEDELHLIRMYLDLEHLRFQGRFRFDLIVDPAIDTKQRIPSMLVQPYIENAVMHGLSPLADGGLLRVEFARTDDGILCTVEDNGIGRDKALASRSTGASKSMGMAITQERLDVLNAKRNRAMKITVTDLHDAAGAAAGTRVDLFLHVEEPDD